MLARDIRRQYQLTKVKPKEFTRVGPYLAWRNVAHHSTQIYLLQITRNDGELIAEHAMVTTKCEFKKLGLARPTIKEVEAWQRLMY